MARESQGDAPNVYPLGHPRNPRSQTVKRPAPTPQAAKPAAPSAPAPAAGSAPAAAAAEADTKTADTKVEGQG